MQVAPTRAFLRDLKRLSPPHRQAVIKALETFTDKPQTRALNFETVRARKGYHTIRATIGVRILLREVAQQSFEIVAVGNHDFIYGKR